MSTGFRFNLKPVSTSSEMKYQLVDETSEVDKAVKALKGCEHLSIDCEGVRLGRDGELCLLQATAKDVVYIFDIVKLGKTVFDQTGFKELLEDPNIPKYLYDCREDCNVLLHHFNVDVKGIQDIQIMDMVRMKLNGNMPDCVNGMQKVMSAHRIGGESTNNKELMKRRFIRDPDFWKKRPLDEVTLSYAASDVFYLQQLREATLSNIPSKYKSGVVEVVKYASHRYADFKARNDKYSRDSVYICNARLPINIIPEMTRGEDKLTFKRFPTEWPKKCMFCNQGGLEQQMIKARRQCLRCKTIDDRNSGFGSLMKRRRYY